MASQHHDASVITYHLACRAAHIRLRRWLSFDRKKRVRHYRCSRFWFEAYVICRFDIDFACWQAFILAIITHYWAEEDTFNIDRTLLLWASRLTSWCTIYAPRAYRGLAHRLSGYKFCQYRFEIFYITAANYWYASHAEIQAKLTDFISVVAICQDERWWLLHI